MFGDAMKLACPSCGSAKATSRELKRYHYTESGLNDIVLRGGVLEISCSRCKDVFVFIEGEQQLLQVIAIDLLSSPRPLSGPEQAFLRGSCDLTQSQMARLLGFARRETIAERESKESELPLDAEFHFRAIVLSAFWEHLRSGRNSFLAPAHLRRLNETREDFLRLAKRGSRKPGKLEIRWSADRLWTPTEMASAA